MSAETPVLPSSFFEQVLALDDTAERVRWYMCAIIGASSYNYPDVIPQIYKHFGRPGFVFFTASRALRCCSQCARGTYKIDWHCRRRDVLAMQCVRFRTTSQKNLKRKSRQGPKSQRRSQGSGAETSGSTFTPGIRHLIQRHQSRRALTMPL